MVNTVESLVKNFSFYEELNDKQKQNLRDSAKIINYKKGDLVYNPNQKCLGIMYIITGQLRVYMMSEQGREITLYRLKPDEVCTLSASCLIDTITFDVYIEASQDCDVLVLNSAFMKELRLQSKDVDNAILTITTERFSDVMWTMHQILFHSMDKRLAVFLYEEFAQNGWQTITLTHEEISRFIGSAREVVSRMLKYFANEGYVTVSRKGIDIVDKKGLIDLASNV